MFYYRQKSLGASLIIVWNWLPSAEKRDPSLAKAIYRITGFYPSKISLYRLAITHRSKAHAHQSNERLEYLGDAVLGTVVSECLFKAFPHRNEGFLSEVRARIVNRESLTALAIKIGLDKILWYDEKSIDIRHIVSGNALEALIGAIYLDKKYVVCKKFILNKLIQPYFDLHTIAHSDINYKSKVIKWAQQNKVAIRFEINSIQHDHAIQMFTIQVILGNKVYGEGTGHTKRKAEQSASKKTCLMLNLK